MKLGSISALVVLLMYLCSANTVFPANVIVVSIHFVKNSGLVVKKDLASNRPRKYRSLM